MRPLDINNVKPAEILKTLFALCPQAKMALARSEHIAAQVLPYQAALLYWLAEEYNQDGARILEIGTYQGYSTSILAQAAPRAQITSLNPSGPEMAQARVNLVDYRNITLLPHRSWDFYAAGPERLEMIFVDGYHKQAARDLIWWNRLVHGGLMLWHDSTVAGSGYIVLAIDKLLAHVKKLVPDVRVIDSNGIGMAGIYADVYRGWPELR